MSREKWKLLYFWNVGRGWGGTPSIVKDQKKIVFFLLWRLPKLLASIPPWGEGEGLLDNVQIFIVFFMAYLRIKIILKNQQRPFDCLANPFKDFPLSLYVYAEGWSHVLVIRFHVYMKFVQRVFCHENFMFQWICSYS